MDKGKKLTTAMKKHSFWILCAIVILGGLTIWQTTSADWSARFQAEKEKRESLRQQVQSVAGDAEPHNEITVEKIRQVHGETSQNVLKAWEILYAEQTKLNPWPSDLGPRFLSIVESLKPEDPIPPDECYNYAVFIKNYVPKLKLLVNMRMTRQELDDLTSPPDKKPKRPPRRTAAAKSIDPEAAVRAAAEEEKSLELVGVIWWDDCARVQDRYYRWQSQPTSQEVRLAQEDLWVYEALLRIIRDTNEGANEVNAPIKRLQSLSIADEAAGRFAAAQNRVFGGSMGMGMDSGSSDMGSMSPGSGSSFGMGEGPPMGGSGGMGGGPPMGASGGMGGGSPMGASGGMGMPPGASGGGAPMGASGGGMGMPPGASGGSDVGGMGMYGMGGMGMYGRYVDQNGQPLAPGAEQPFKEFKMMPVHMVLVMDHRRVPKLLANCANSSMPVEVRRVGLLGGAGGGGAQYGSGMSGGGMSGSSSSGSGNSSGMSSGSSGGFSNPSGGSRGMGMMSPGASGSSSMGGMAGGSVDLGPYDMTVEIEGIIFIFNAPSVESGSAEGAAAAGTAAEAAGAAPAATVKPPANAPADASEAPGTPAAPPTPVAEPPVVAKPPAAPGAPTPKPAPSPGPSPGSPPTKT